MDRIQEKLHSRAERPVTLGELRPGQRAVVHRINGPLTKRIADMGVTPGTVVEVERVAPLGDPIDIRVKGYHLSVRRREAADITVRLV